VKPIGKPSAGNRHARFDERGWETERWPMAPSYRAHPRLYPFDRSQPAGRARQLCPGNSDVDFYTQGRFLGT